MKFGISTHWGHTDFFLLSGCVPCAASGYVQSCVLINLMFLDIGNLVFDMIRLYMVFAYSKMGRIITENRN